MFSISPVCAFLAGISMCLFLLPRVFQIMRLVELIATKRADDEFVLQASFMSDTATCLHSFEEDVRCMTLLKEHQFRLVAVVCS